MLQERLYLTTALALQELLHANGLFRGSNNEPDNTRVPGCSETTNIFQNNYGEKRKLISGAT